VHPPGGTISKREPQIGGLKLWAIMFLCPSERSDEAAWGLTFGPRIEGAALPVTVLGENIIAVLHQRVAREPALRVVSLRRLGRLGGGAERIGRYVVVE
jgi:hypothetical protein